MTTTAVKRCFFYNNTEKTPAIRSPPYDQTFGDSGKEKYSGTAICRDWFGWRGGTEDKRHPLEEIDNN